MLLTFRVSNFRSFKEEVTISLLATRLDSGYGVPTRVTPEGSEIQLLPVAAILGANASGKSNLLRAMAAMRQTVLTSATRTPFETLTNDYFRLDPACADLATLMELNFVIDRNRYQYGFEIASGRVVGEWLHTFPHKRTQVLFDREGSDYQFGKNLGGQNRVIAEITRPQVLFLSAAAQAGHPILSKIYEYFYSNLILLDVPDRGRITGPTLARMRDRERRAVAMVNHADLGIVDIRVTSNEMLEERRQAFREIIKRDAVFPPEMSEEERSKEIESIINRMEDQEADIELLHRAGKNKSVPLPFEEESLGTKSWLSFVSHALDALDRGATLLVDELDASLHPLLLSKALGLFQSQKTNRFGAQLIFTTHDVTLLSQSLDNYKLSRGQVWLTEKGDDGSSSLVPLSDYRPRKGEDLARGYLQGRYGGTPRIAEGTLHRAAKLDILDGT